MAEETVMIDVTEGPERGKRLTVPADIGKQAIKDGWARDPFAEPKEGEKEPPPPTDEERGKAIAAAAKAMRKLRGEEDEEAKPKGKAEAKQPEPEEDDDGDEAESRNMTAGRGGSYETRDVPEKRGPGRPRKY